MYIDRLLIIDSGLNNVDTFMPYVQPGVFTRRFDAANPTDWANMLDSLDGKRYSYVCLVTSRRRLMLSNILDHMDIMNKFVHIFPTPDEATLPYVTPHALDLCICDMEWDQEA